MRVVLEQLDSGTFSYFMETRVKRGMVRPRIQQKSLFNWNSGLAAPDSFRSTVKVAFFKRKESVDFNWESMIATGKKKRSNFSLDIQPGMHDKLTIHLGLARSLCKGVIPYHAEVVSGPILKPYAYHLQAAECLDTELGRLQTHHVRMGTPETEKQTDSWHARQVHFLPVKIIHRDKNGTSTMNLIDISFDETNKVDQTLP